MMLTRSKAVISYKKKVDDHFTRLIATTDKGPVGFKAFDLNAATVNNLEIGDEVIIDWYIDGSYRKYNKIYQIYKATPVENTCVEPKEERKQSMIISGKISSLKNSRGMSSKKSEEVAFTVKPKRGEKVSYCYAPSNFTQSRWFQKGNDVKLEVSPMGTVNNHKAYSVITLWEK